MWVPTMDFYEKRKKVKKREKSAGACRYITLLVEKR